MGLKYYGYIIYAPLSNLSRKASNNTDNQLMDFSDSSWQYCPDTVRSTGACIIFYQGDPIEYGTNVPGSVAQSSS